MMRLERYLATMALLCGMTTFPTHAQSAGQLDLSVSYNANPNRLTNGSTFLLQGGSAELAAHLPHGFAAVASVTGLHAGAATGGIAQNLFIAAVGPRYTLSSRRQRGSLFLQGLVGEAHGFDGVFPAASGATFSATAFAFKVGGGIDIALTHHLRLRPVQLDFLQTQLPNGSSNNQRSILAGAGIVWHTGGR